MYYYDFYKHKTNLIPELHFNTCGFERCIPGKSVHPSIPDYYSFHIVLEGSGSYTIGSKTHYISAGNGFLLFPNELCYYTPDLRKPWSYYWFSCSGSSVMHFLKSICSVEDPVFSHNYSIEQLSKSIYELSKSSLDVTLRTLQFNGLLHQIFYKLIEHNRKTINSHTTKNQYLDYSLGFIHSFYSQKMTVKDIAQYIHVDRTYLYHIFMNEYGISPQQYIIQYRIKKATQLLLESDCTIKSISEAVGYTDYSLFCRTFKKFHQVSPSVFRKNIQT